MIYLFSFILFLLPLIRGGNRFFIIYPVLILLLSSVIYIIIRELKNSGTRADDFLLPKEIFIPFSLFAVILLISSVYSINILATINMLLTFLGMLMALYISNKISSSQINSSLPVYTMIFSATLQPVIAFFQLLDFIPHEYWNPAHFMAGSFVNHNHFAGMLEITLPLTIAVFINKKKIQGMKFIFIVSIVIQTLGLFFSFSRGAWISLFFLLILLLIQKEINKTYIISIIIISCLSLFVIFNFKQENSLRERFRTFQNLKEDLSSVNRLKIWKSSFEVIRDNFLTGTGPGTFRYAFPLYRVQGLYYLINHAHNEYIEWACETGIFSLPVIIFIIGYLIFKGIRFPMSISPYPFAASAALLSIALHGITDFNMRIPANMIYIAAVLGPALRDLCRLHVTQVKTRALSSSQ